MSEPHDSRRLLESDDAAFAELAPGLREARSQGPSPEQRARMRAALGLPATSEAPASNAAANAPAADGPAAATQSAPVAGTYPAWVKLTVLGALGVSAVFAVQRWVHGVRPEPASVAQREGVQPGTSPVEPAVLSPSALRVEREPAVLADAAVQQREPRRARADTRRRGSAAGVGATEPPPPGPADPAAELVLLKRAKAHARSAPERALVLLTEHERRFAHGALVQEREVIAIEALLASGRRDAAQQRTARFFERFPDSAHARRVRALLGGPDNDVSDTNIAAPPHPSP